MTSRSHKTAAFYAAAVLFWLIVWQLAAVFVNRSLLIPIPTPVSTLSALFSMAGQVKFWLTVGASLLRICLGFAAALILGTICALISAKSEFFRILTSPLLQLVRAIPVASFTIVIFLWVSREKIPTAISFLTVFPIVWANVENGARSIDRRLFDLAQVFGMTRRDRLRKILLPGIRPFFLSAVASGMGFAWKSGVAAEVICRTANSLGDLLWSSKSVIAYDEVFAETLVIVILSSLLQIAAGKVLNAKKRTKAVPACEVEASPSKAAASPTIAAGNPSEASGSSSEAAGTSTGHASPSLPERPSIELDRVTFSYARQKDLFKDYSLVIPSGSRICLTGPSGIGKSTLTRLICGLETPKSGNIRGTEGASFSVDFQDDLLIPHLSVLQNVTLFAPGQEVKAAGLLKHLGLGDHINDLPSELSGGMRRRAALARALCHSFDVLVLDEAFTGLDADTKQQCLAAVRNAVSGKILIMVTHDTKEAEDLGADVIRL